MKVLKPGKTSQWEGSTTRECSPHASIWRVKGNNAKVTFGPVLHGHLAFSGLLLLGKLKFTVLSYNMCMVSACHVTP